MRRLFVLTVLLFALPAHAVTIDWVTVGDPGNAADTDVQGYGSVPYTYLIGKYEVTNAQYTEFLNAVATETDYRGLYRGAMAASPRGGITRSLISGRFTYIVNAGMGSKPVNYVSFYDALRFANWLHNGQPTGGQDAGTTEDGAYTLLGSEPEDVARNPWATVFLPSRDEWYKAAYYDPLSKSYFDYPYIKPGSDPNSINPFSRGVIPVAILTTEDFDALTVDEDSVLFGPAEAEKKHKRAHIEDVDDDGDLDLVLHFRTQDTGIALGDTEACLIGQTYDGAPNHGLRFREDSATGRVWCLGNS